MNTSPDFRKKQEERQFLNHCMQACNEFPSGKIIRGESPDFIIKPKTKESIGVELTKLILPTSGFRSNTKDLKSLVFDQVRSIVLNNNNSNVSLHLRFSPDFEKLKPKRAYYTNVLSDITLTRIKQFNTESSFKHIINHSELPNGIDSAIILQHTDDTEPVWSFCYEKIKQKELIDNIELSISKKGAKLKIYRQKACNSFYLLLTTNCLKYSVSFNLDNLLSKMEFHSDFDRIFLFDYFGEKVYSLK